MKTQNNFIKFNENNSTVELTLSFHVNEAQDTRFFPKHELTFHSFYEILLDALEQRMKHCKDILTTEILPAKDKVFTPVIIFSNEVGKHFSIKAYQAMENAMNNLRSFHVRQQLDNPLQAFLRQLNPLQAQQCFKALATMKHNNIKEDLYLCCIDAIAEAALCNKDAE